MDDETEFEKKIHVVESELVPCIRKCIHEHGLKTTRLALFWILTKVYEQEHESILQQIVINKREIEKDDVH